MCVVSGIGLQVAATTSPSPRPLTYRACPGGALSRALQAAQLAGLGLHYGAHLQNVSHGAGREGAAKRGSKTPGR
jgi:hypothetical protein